jgi:aspartyl-tRNA(Asn)/glutamyl-tRNA(Gln) amidotransferase subunit C
MSTTPEFNIDHLALLARLDLSAEEKAAYTAQIGEVLEHMAKLREVDVTGIEPMAHAIPLDNVWRGDEAEAGLPVEEALRNAPARRDNMIAVPPVVE